MIFGAIQSTSGFTCAIFFVQLNYCNGLKRIILMRALVLEKVRGFGCGMGFFSFRVFRSLCYRFLSYVYFNMSRSL